MISYPPTTLPSSPPYHSLDAILIVLCDRCLAISADDTLPVNEINQHFDFTMAIVDFWFHELEEERDYYETK